MITVINEHARLTAILEKQISSFFELQLIDKERINLSFPKAYDRALFCFKHINNKYYSQFRETHSGQWGAFLYYLANEIYLTVGSNETSDKIYYLNKIMHSFDLYYEIKLPDIFYWEHPVGTVFGRGVYSNYFMIYQNCTIGASWDKEGNVHYPTMDENVTLFSYACILGKCHIGKNTIISSHAYIINMDIPENSIVFGQGKDLVIKPNLNKRASGVFKP